MAIISLCRKYRASEKVFILLCMLPNTHPFNLRQLAFIKIFFVCGVFLCFSSEHDTDFIPYSAEPLLGNRLLRKPSDQDNNGFPIYLYTS